MKKLALFVVILFQSIWVQAEGNLTPVSAEGVNVVTAQKASELIQQGALAIDTRSAINFGRSHLPGAKLFSYKGSSENTVDFDASQDQFRLDELDIEPNAPLLFYSHGETGWKSYKAAVTAVRVGYQQVYWLRGGLSEWENSGFETER